MCVRVPELNPHTVYKKAIVTESLNQLTGLPFWFEDSTQFQIVCRKQNRADIYGAGVGHSLLGNLMPSGSRLCNPLSSLSSPDTCARARTHARTRLYIMNDLENRGSMTFNRQYQCCCDRPLSTPWLSGARPAWLKSTRFLAPRRHI